MGSVPKSREPLYEEMMCVVSVTKGHSGNGCGLASILCKYDLRKDELFVLSWARVRQVMRRMISSELFCYCLFWLDA